MRKRNLVILTNTSGGLYLFRRDLIKTLLNRWDVTALTTDSGHIEDLKKIGCNIVSINMDRRGTNPFRDVILLIQYLFFLHKKKAEYVITYTIKSNIYGGMACRVLKIPYSCNITGLGTAFEKSGLLKQFVVMLYKFSLKDAKKVFFENSDNATLFINYHITDSSKVCILHGAGVDLDYFSYHEYPQENEKIHFLFMGRIMKEKGIDELFYAMERLSQEGYNCCLDLLGGCTENYNDIIRIYEKKGWLNYYGYQEDVRPYIIKAHCFVLPSWHEGMANTNLESASMGRPIITSNIPGCREAVIDGVDGFLCEKRNKEDLYAKMLNFLKLPYDDKRQMGINARKHMQRSFDKKEVVNITVENLFN